MPPIARTAFRIFFVALLLHPIVGYLDATTMPSIPSDALPMIVIGALIFLVPFFGVFAFIVYKAYRGRNWARWPLAALTTFGLVAYIPYLSDSLTSSPAFAIADLVLSLAQLLAAALLFTNDSNAWYRAQGAQAEQAAAS